MIMAVSRNSNFEVISRFTACLKIILMKYRYSLSLIHNIRAYSLTTQRYISADKCRYITPTVQDEGILGQNSKHNQA